MTLSEYKNKAKDLSKETSLTYNQALHNIAKSYGYKSYHAVLKELKNQYIFDENQYISEFKTNIFKNQKHIKSNFEKINKLNNQYIKIDQNEELKDNILAKADNIADNIAKIIFTDILYKFLDNSLTSFEVPCFALYTSSDYLTFHNDIDANNADILVDFNILDKSIDISFRDFTIETWDEEDYYDGKIITKSYKEWLDWEENQTLYLP